MAKQASPVFMPSILLDREMPAPLHRQLYEGLRTAILTGQLRPGIKLPSTREWASHFQVSRNTVLTAFEQLLADGFLEGKVGSGTFVAAGAGFGRRAEAVASRAASAAEPPPISEVASLLLEDRPETSTGIGAFRASMPALDLFPWSAWSQLVSSAARRLTREQLMYSDPRGLLPFREAVAAYLRTARNVRCEADQVFVVSGSQQALFLAATVLLNRGDAVWMEDPGYYGARSAFLLNGNPIQPVPIDRDGLCVEEGRRLCPAARMVYVTPSHQYPLGVTMSLERRLELVDWAEGNRSWIVEDDYDSEFRYVSRPLSSLQGLSEGRRVLYTGTFSKVMFPSLRLGYLVVPPGLVDAFRATREAVDVYPATLSQAALTAFIENGGFARHMRRMRSAYAQRLAEITACIERDLAGVARVEAADSGMYVTAYLPAEIDDVRVCRDAATRGIELAALSRLYIGGGGRSGLILGFGGTDLKQIREGIAVLKEVLDAAPRRAAAESAI